jgi:hypothetical protein
MILQKDRSNAARSIQMNSRRPLTFSPVIVLRVGGMIGSNIAPDE